MTATDRIVVLIDMDCFYCQVEEKLNPELKGKPIAVVQYNQWQGGGIIAVNYLARARGVTRHMRGDEAKTKCPEIELPSVPCVRGKADISKYRDAGKDVALVLQEFTPLLERASIDEAYLDITDIVNHRNEKYKLSGALNENDLPDNFILGYDNLNDFIHDIYNKNDMDCEMEGFDKDHSRKLLAGAIIVREIRKTVYEKTGFRCSAGIAHNKTMAKLVCGFNKPNKQTVLPKNSVPILFQSLPVSKIKHLGGKFGETICKTLNITNMMELTKFTEKELQKKFDEKNGSWLYNIARGIDNEPVTPRFNAKSIGCCKKFPGKTAIADVKTLVHWLKELACEIQERLKTDSEENRRYPTRMVTSFTKFINGKDASCSRSVNLSKDDIFNANVLSMNALSSIRKDSIPFCLPERENADGEQKMILANPIKFLGISVGKFENNTNPKKGIEHFFDQNKSTNRSEVRNENASEISPNIPSDTRKPAHSKTRHVHEDVPARNSFFAKFMKKTTTPPEEVSSEQLPKRNVDFDDRENTMDENEDSNHSTEAQRDTFTISKFFDSSMMNDDDSGQSSQGNGDDKFRCDLCKRHFDESDRQIHQDYHFALSLKEEKRREVEPVGTNTKLPRNRRAAKRKRPDAKAESNTIVKLFQKINSVAEADFARGEDGIACDECGKTVSSSKLGEHLDYHEAKRLHSELNKPKIITLPTKACASPEKKNKVKTMNISSFFQGKT